MRWAEIRKMYPNQFILLENVIEEQISDSKYRVLSGDVIKTSSELKEILKEYSERKKLGKNVVYTLPNTPEDFIIENVPMMSIF